MEKHTINTKSWHYKFINRFKPFGTYDRPEDICEYRRWFINAFFRMLVIYFMITLFILVPLTITGAWVAAWYSTGVWGEMPAPVAFFWIVVFGCVVTAVFGYLGSVYNDWKEARKESQPVVAKKPGTVAVAYRALKQKYCVKVEFE